MPVPQDAIAYLEYVLAHKNNVLLPFIVGPLLDIFVAGIYTTQLVNYFVTLSPGHSKITCLVVLVAILSTLKTAAALYILFLNSIILNGNIIGWALAAIQNWVLVTTPLMTTMIDLAVQSYYVALLHRLLNAENGQRFHPAFRWTLLGTIFAAFTASVTLGIITVWEILSLTFNHPARLLTLQLGTSFLGDALISGGTIYCLLGTDAYTTAHRPTINRFAWVIGLSAAVPALMALLNFLIVATDVFYNRWHVVFDFLLSKSFAISFMWTIRVRRSLVAGSSKGHPTSISARRSVQLTSEVPPTVNAFMTPSMFAATVQMGQSQLPDHIELDRRPKILERDSSEFTHQSV